MVIKVLHGSKRSLYAQNLTILKALTFLIIAILLFSSPIFTRVVSNSDNGSQDNSAIWTMTAPSGTKRVSPTPAIYGQFGINNNLAC